MSETDEIIQMLCRSAADFTARHSDLELQKRGIGQPLQVDRTLWRDMAELGWLGLALPEQLGGSGMGAAAAAALCEVLGKSLFAQPYIAAALLPSPILAAAQATALAQGLASGDQMLCLAWQERPGQADLVAAETRLENGSLNGRKVFVAGLEPDSIMLVSAIENGLAVIAAVDARASGVTVKRLATAQGSYSEVVFDQVTVREGKPLLHGGAALESLLAAIALARIAASAQLAGIAAGCLEQTVEYVSQRVQFGHPIGSFQSVKHRCVDLRIGVALADAAWRHAADQFDKGNSDTAAVYAAKARCGDVGRTIGREAVQLHGAMGFTEECDIGLFLRAALQYASWLGSPVTMRRQFLAQADAPDKLPEAAYA